MILRRYLAIAFALAAGLAVLPAIGGAQSAPSPDPASPSPLVDTPSPTPSARALGLPLVPSGLVVPGAGTSPQAYATFVKKAERQSGLIDILRRDDDTYFDLTPAAFDHPFIVAPVLASGAGDQAFAGRVFDSFIVEFKRVGKRVLWVAPNSSFSAPPGSAAANSLAISVSDTVINSTPVVAEDESKHVVVSAAFFLTDFENVAKTLGESSPQPLVLLGLPSRSAFSVDASKSYIERTKALPANDEILANLAFAGPPGDVGSAPDGRGIRLRMHYSIVDPHPSRAYVPRLADDRIGYFITAQKQFDNDALPTPFVRYIDRWNFENGPVVYYLTNEIPAQYKATIRSALLAWNSAFAQIGIPNAVEVRDQPSDPGWDPDDARYSTVRWITSDRPTFSAYGPHTVDPRTGEILRVEIVIDGETLRSVKRGFVDQVAPIHPTAFDAAGLPLPTGEAALGCDDTNSCDRFVESSAELAADGTVALRLAGGAPAQTERYAEAWLRAAVLHEAGHNFGLRHNFAGSALYPLARLHDRAFTEAHGLVASVMDYTPVNLSPPGRPQGTYFQQRLGPYDRWAIRYGYERFPSVRRPDDERIALRGIADESSRPEYAYATDEDANGPLAVDPRVASFDLGSDPLDFDANQFALYRGLLGRLDRAFARDDQPYYEERRTFETILTGYARAALLASKYIGGIETSRTHRGQTGGRPPFVPVSRATARRAFDVLAANVFSSRALHFSPQLLADLGTDHYVHRGVQEIERPDYPLAETLADLQDTVMFRLFAPTTMSRVADEALKAPSGARPMVLADLFEWTQAAVWADLGRGPIDPVQRGLQRRYGNLLIAFALAPSFVIEGIGYPTDAPSLARYELRRLAGRLDLALRAPALDVATRAHLEDERSRVRHALDPGAVRGA